MLNAILGLKKGVSIQRLIRNRIRKSILKFVNLLDHMSKTDYSNEKINIKKGGFYVLGTRRSQKKLVSSLHHFSMNYYFFLIFSVCLVTWPFYVQIINALRLEKYCLECFAKTPSAVSHYTPWMEGVYSDRLARIDFNLDWAEAWFFRLKVFLVLLILYYLFWKINLHLHDIYYEEAYYKRPRKIKNRKRRRRKKNKKVLNIS